MALLTCKMISLSPGIHIADRVAKLKGTVRTLTSKQLVYSQFGDPLQVVKFRDQTVPELKPTEVLVRMLAAPVNPADINTIQGKYPVKVELPSVAGNEGVGIVEDVGKDVQEINKGNKVIVTKPVQGTWRNVATFRKDVLKVVPDELGTVEAATLTVNPCTAYRMLSDFLPVKEKGLVVIQNGANSACGQNVIQICKAWGVNTINIVRNRPEIDELKKFLQNLGATYVLTEEELRSTTLFKEKKIEKPSLALNCVGGKSSLEILRHLQHSGKMVTYGGMSREPVTIPTSAFIFKNASFHGFWMTAWNEKASKSEKDKMMSEIINLMIEKKLKGPAHKMVKFDNYEEALGNALTAKGFTGCTSGLFIQLPRIGGCEGVGKVVEVGKLVSRFELGDRVLVGTRPFLGTWRYYGIYNEQDLFPVSVNVPLPEASTIVRAPAAAYRMIKDFTHVCHGNTIIQNAANSPVGQSVIQLSACLGINTFNILGTQFQFESVRKNLECMGATTVFTIDEAERIRTFLTSLRRPTLGISCFPGRHEDVIVNLLEKGGTMVYYYGCECPFARKARNKSRRPDITYYDFDLSKWYCNATCKEKNEMISDISKFILVGKFRAPLFCPMELKEYVYAFRNTASCEAFSTLSYIFDFTKV